MSRRAWWTIGELGKRHGVAEAMGPIGVLWLRQLKQFWRSKIRMISSLAQPLLFLFAFGFGLRPIYGKAEGADYVAFIAPGIVGMSLLVTGVFSGLEIIWDKQFGFLKATLAAPVPRTNIMLGRTLGGATVAFIHGTLVFMVTLLIGFRPFALGQLPVAALCMVLTAMAFTAVGSALATKIDDMQGFPLLMNLFVMPLFFLSGALFPLRQLPNVLYGIALANPMTYAVDLLRGTLSGVHQFAYGVDALVLCVVTAIAFAAGAFLFSRMEG